MCKRVDYAMLKRVQAFIERHELLKENSTIVIGVSGGPDSLALLHVLWSIHHPKNLKLIVAHVDHMFRGKQSEKDLLYVDKYCQSLGVVFEAKQINVRNYQKTYQLSSQVAARNCRYQFFEQIMVKYHADYLALGHHGDDQIETVLMRLVRGSTSLGYAGIQAIRSFGTGRIIRPFLSVSKREIEQYCEQNKLNPRIDPSNEKDDYTRNRFRHHILPFLKQENSQVHERIQHFSELITEDECYLKELTIEKMNKVIKKKDEAQLSFYRKRFLSMPKPLQRRGIQLILNYLYPEIPPSLSTVHIDNLLSLLKNEHPSGMLHFPNGLRIVRSYDECILTFGEEEAQSYRFTLDIPGHTYFSNGSEIISEIWGCYPDGMDGNDVFIIDPDLISLPLYVRSREIGDKVSLKGMNGTKKVKDIFIDNKIPLHERQVFPLIEDNDGRIIWLPGLKKSSYEAKDVTKDEYIVLLHNKQ